MNAKIRELEFKLSLQEDIIASSKEMIKMNKKGLFFCGISSVLIIGMQIFTYDIKGSPIKMYNIMSTCFFITATYYLFMQSLRNLSDYRTKLSFAEIEKRVILDLIKLEKKHIGEYDENKE